MRYGIIGLGRWGRIVASALHELNLLHAVSSSQDLSNDPLMTKNVKKMTLADMLDDEIVDTIYVATPHKFLSSIAKSVIEANKHLILEKPGGVSIEDIIGFNETKKSCYINYMYAQDPAFLLLKSRLTGQKIREMSFQWNKFGSFDNDIVLNLLSHVASMIIEMDPELDHIEIDNVNITDDSVDMRCRTDMIDDCHIFIDRRSHVKNKILSIKTDKSNYLLETGKLTVNNEVDLEIMEPFLRYHLRSLDKNIPNYVNNVAHSIKVFDLLSKAKSIS